MTDRQGPRAAQAGRTETRVAAAGTVASLTALFSAAACCVLPLALAAVGLGAGGLAFLVPFHRPLTILAAVAVAAGWALYARRRAACSRSADCSVRPPSRATLVMLIAATAFVLLSAIWPLWIEPPLVRALGGA